MIDDVTAKTDSDSDEIKDTDIVFDCQYCGKSLAIDYRGAGLSIPCTDCGKMVVVPIPDGMEIDDLDKTDQDRELIILHLRKALTLAHEKISELTAELEEVSHRREDLENQRVSNISKFKEVREQAKIISKSLNDLSDAAERLLELTE